MVVPSWSSVVRLLLGYNSCCPLTNSELFDKCLNLPVMEFILENEDSSSTSSLRVITQVNEAPHVKHLVQSVAHSRCSRESDIIGQFSGTN